MIEALAVVVPARDEEGSIGACLRSVLVALDRASLPSVVVVVANRCVDRTALRAAVTLGPRGVVVRDDTGRVGAVRRRGVEEALYRLPVPQDAILLLSTDADTTVPPDWAVRMLDHARRGAAAVAGLTELAAGHGLSPGAVRAYDRLIADGIDGEVHRHAYAANLGVRADAYLAVGGWSAAPVGEEHVLLDRLEGGGWPVRRPVDVVVSTSGRRRARARDGLGDLLADLDRTAREVA